MLGADLVVSIGRELEARLEAEEAIEEAGVDRDKIGVLINTSVCRDYLEPSTACLVHGNLGLHERCLNFDIGNACLAFLNGMDVAARMIERGEVANSWRTERWDSLRLLTPNWQCRLSGQRYSGPDPDGYMTMPQVVEYLDRYARSLAAPVQTGTTVAPLFAIIFAVKVRQPGSMGRENGLADVETVPPGNTPIAPPSDR